MHIHSTCTERYIHMPYEVKIYELWSEMHILREAALHESMVASREHAILLEKRLLQNQKFVNIIAKSATLCARQKRVVCFSVCTAGKHRSVAACACLQDMFREYVSPSASIKVQHLESDAWAESKSAGKCIVRVAPLPQDVCAKLDEIWAMLPFRQDVPEVRVVEL